MTVAGAELCALIPHAGSMCLLERVEAWDDDRILCTTSTHLRADNPLRSAEGLAAVHGVEYGAQAMAVHGGLLARRDGGALPSGYLAAVRDLRLHAPQLDMAATPLQVSAERLMAERGNLMYRIEVAAGGQILVEARVTVAALNGRGA